MSRSKRSTRSRRSRKNGSVPKYTGPIRLPVGDGLDAAPIRVNLTYAFDVVSEPGGVVRNYIAPNGLVSTSDWSNYTSSYQEFRVLGIEWHYEPNFNGTYDVNFVQGCGASAIVHVPLASSPANLDEVVATTAWKPFRTSVSTKAHWRMRGFEEAPYTSTASLSAGNHGGIIFYADGLTGEVTYGKGIVTYLVEFRSRR